MKPVSSSSRLCALLAALALPALMTTACGTRGAVDVAVEQTGAAASDALGRPQDRPGPVMAEDEDVSVPTPYGGYGADRACLPVARDIARITLVLGPDEETGVPEHETEEETYQRSLWDRGRDLLAQAPDAAGDAAGEAYRSAIVGLSPVRPVGRYVMGSGRIEAQAREQREMAVRRRAYLRGVYDGMACERGELETVFGQYGLIARDSGVISAQPY